ncbi:hypothetical protein NPIL_327371 [Nephila pilipes]|uniref:Uncharacterized protein n=1 Tax=Nephila pilipes TaxID=299642 RepID=A0A8X6IQG3_NEPPI|nr:hypothetical protein NPIL_327371 [Nephila pilipes]
MLKWDAWPRKAPHFTSCAWDCQALCNRGLMIFVLDHAPISHQGLQDERPLITEGSTSCTSSVTNRFSTAVEFRIHDQTKQRRVCSIYMRP